MPVKLNSSGGGSVTIDVPSTASSYTLTAPAATATLITTGSSGRVIPKDALPTGSVLQVVSTFDTTTTTGTTNNYDVLSTTITPTSSTSKILLLAQVSWFSNIDHGGLYFMRNGSPLARNSGATYINSTVSASFDNNNYGTNGNGSYGANPMMYLDSPATASAITYNVRTTMTGGSANWYYNRSVNSGAQASTSSLILMEIAV